MTYFDEAGIKRAFRRYLIEECGYSDFEATFGVSDFPNIYTNSYLTSECKAGTTVGGVYYEVRDCCASDPGSCFGAPQAKPFKFSILFRAEDVKHSTVDEYTAARKLYRIRGSKYAAEAGAQFTVPDALRKAFKKGDLAAADSLIEAHKEEWDGDLEYEALKLAVETGCGEYVSEHLEDYDAYELVPLFDIANGEMTELLKEYGLCHEFDYFEGSSLALETINCTVLSFTPEFQKKVWNRFMRYHKLKKADVLRVLGEEVPEEDTFGDGITAEDIAFMCELFKVTAEDGKFVFEPFGFMDDSAEDIDVLRETVEELGYEFSFEGDAGGEGGVYYIK